MEPFKIRIWKRVRRQPVAALVVAALVVAAAVAVPVAVTASVQPVVVAHSASDSKPKPVVMGTYSAGQYKSAAANVPAALGAAVSRDLHLTPAQYLADAAASVDAVKVLAALKGSGIEVLGSRMDGTQLTVNVSSRKDVAAVEATGATAVIGAPVTKNYGKIAFQAVSATNTYGGEPYFYQESGGADGEGFRCSIGFNGYSGIGAPEFLTAGHCETTMTGSAYYIDVTSPTAPGDSNGTLGAALGTGVLGKYGSGSDYGVISTSASYAPQPGIATWGGGGDTAPIGGTNAAPEAGTLPITGETAALVGDNLCKSGSTTGWTCGTVLAVDTTVSVSGQDVNSIVASTCLLPGDSGGAAVDGTSIAVGIDSGGSFGDSCTPTTDNPSPESVFFPMVSAKGSNSVSGQLGSNFQLAVPVSSIASVTSPVPGAEVTPVSAITGTITGATVGSTALLYLDGSNTPFAKATASSGSWTIPLTGISLGVHSYSIAAGVGWSAGTPVSGSFTVVARIPPVAPVLSNVYQASGGSAGWLGYPAGDYTCGLTNGGCFQAFNGGWIVQSSAGIFAVPNAVVQAWGWYGRDTTTILGYPSAAPTAPPNGSYVSGSYSQTFQNGTISVVAGVPALASTTDPWYSAVLASPWLGSSTQAKSCTLKGGACYGAYQNGWIVQSAAGTFGVPTAVLTAWNWYGRDTAGILGFPSAQPSALSAGTYASGTYSQTFQGGLITVTNGSPALTSTTDPWYNVVLTSTWLGTSTQAKSCALKGGACYQVFQNGWVVQSNAGVYAVPNSVETAWNWYGRDTAGILGFPSAAATAPSGGNYATGSYSQAFQGGLITVTNGSPALTSTTDPWYNVVLTTPWLGSSLQAKSCSLTAGGCFQAFQNGWVVQSSSGVFAVPTPVLTGWGWYGRDTNFVGYPTSSSTVPSNGSYLTGTYTQTFQGGTITVTNGSPALTAITDPWQNTILSNPWLGSVTRGKSCTLKGGACYESFQNGWIVQSPAGIFAVPTAVLTAWNWYGRDTAGILGFPSAAPTANPTSGNYSQAFQTGTISVTGGTPAMTATSDPWYSVVLGAPWLGASTQNKSCTLTNGGCYQVFQNGWVVQGSPGVFALPNAVVQGWSWYGRDTNVLGYPTGATSTIPSNSTYTQSFQGGTITVTNGTPLVTLR